MVWMAACSACGIFLLGAVGIFAGRSFVLTFFAVIFRDFLLLFHLRKQKQQSTSFKLLIAFLGPERLGIVKLPIIFYSQWHLQVS